MWTTRLVDLQTVELKKAIIIAVSMKQMEQQQHCGQCDSGGSVSFHRHEVRVVSSCIFYYIPPLQHPAQHRKSKEVDRMAYHGLHSQHDNQVDFFSR